MLNIKEKFGVEIEFPIIDPVLDFDPREGATSTKNAERLLAYVRETGIALVWVLDTHPHADHFSAAP